MLGLAGVDELDLWSLSVAATQLCLVLCVGKK